MPVKEFDIPLGSAIDHLFVHIETSMTLPRRLAHFSIQYSASIGGRWYAVVRYDTSHGVPHRHILDSRGGTRDRKEFLNQTYEQVLKRARIDLIDNWRRYRAAFIEREGLTP